MNRKTWISSLVLLLCGTATQAQTQPPAKPGTIPPSVVIQLSTQSEMYNEAQKLFEARLYVDALDLYRKAFEVDGYFAGAFAGMIDCHLALGNRGEALALYETFFRPEKTRDEVKPQFRFGNTPFATRRGLDYVLLLSETGQLEKARKTLGTVKSEWLRERREQLLRSRIPFDDHEVATKVGRTDIAFQVKLIQGTESLLQRDGFVHYGEPRASTRLEEAQKLSPGSSLVSYLLAESYWRTPERADKTAELLLRSLKQGGKSMRPFVAQWLDSGFVRARANDSDIQLEALRGRLRQGLNPQ
jgi:tetratricopeptide (TPR) repeat protein